MVSSNLIMIVNLLRHLNFKFNTKQRNLKPTEANQVNYSHLKPFDTSKIVAYKNQLSFSQMKIESIFKKFFPKSIFDFF